MVTALYVAVGGAIGSVLRYGIGMAAGRAFGAAFPWGTLIVNVAGCLCMGAAVSIIERMSNGDTALRSFLCIGVLGGFTTFSAFSLDAVTLAQRGDMLHAALYVAGSVVLSVLALMAGLMLVRGVAV